MGPLGARRGLLGRGRVVARVYYGLVGYRRGAGESRVEGIQVVDAAEEGQLAHGG